MAATGKNTQTGLLTTHQYEVKGPVMLFSTTTTIEIDEELLNRCIILTVNEDRAQTRAIHQRQRERYTVEGLWAKDDAARIRKLHQNAQRLLHPLEVVNPFARHLTFLDDKTRTRRDHEKYLTLIGAIALLHQHQRPIKQTVRGGRTKDYIEVQLSDIALANRLANEVLGRSLDELPPQTRQLLMKLDDWVRRECDRLNLRREDFHFTRRALREALGWHDTQLRTHLERLVLLEYVLVHRGGRGQQFVYELLYDGSGQDGRPFVMNLIDVAALNRTPTDTSRGEGEKLAGSKRAENGPKTAGLRSGLAPVQDGGNGGFHPEVPKNAYKAEFELAASYIRNGHSSSLPKGGK